MMKNSLLDLVFFWGTSPCAQLQDLTVTLSERKEADTWCSEVFFPHLLSLQVAVNGSWKTRSNFPCHEGLKATDLLICPHSPRHHLVGGDELCFVKQNGVKQI